MPFAPPNPPPVLILGQGRSGTTLLTTLLNRHPLFASTPETYFWRDLAQYPGGWQAITNDWPASGKAFFQKMDRWEEFGIDAQAAVDHCQASPADPGMLFSAMCQAIADAAGKPRAVEKTPSHVRFLDPIRRYLPTARIIHLIRDGRDVTLSRRKLPWNPKSLSLNFYEWQRIVALGRTRLAGDPHALAVRYEDLVHTPEETCRVLCRFLAVEFDPRMLEPDEADNKVIEQGAYWKQGVRKEVHAGRAAVWRRELEPWQQHLAWAIARDELTRWQYPPHEDLAADQSGASPRVWLSQDIENDAQGLMLDALVQAFLDRGATLAGRTNVLEGPPPPPELEGPGVILLTDSPRTLGWASRSRWALLGATRKVSHRLAGLRTRGLRLIWLHHGQARETQGWPLRARVEAGIAATADTILLPPDTNGDAMPHHPGRTVQWNDAAPALIADELADWFRSPSP